jgi:hypothetical protein
MLNQNKFATCLFSSLLISGIVLAASASARTGDPISQKGDVWQARYWVTVLGDFKREPEVGSGGPTIFYHIKRRYDGKAKLVFEPKPGDPNSGTRYPLFKGPFEISIKVDDFVNTIYDVICDEYQSVEQTWKADVSSIFGSKVTAAALLLINNEKRTFKISLPLLYLPDDESMSDKIKYTKTEILHLRGGVKKEKTFPAERKSFLTHEYPTVRGFLEKTSILRTPDWSELKKDVHTPDSYYWLSEELHPDEPLLPNVPESKDGVNIRIFYEFRKIKD